MVSSTAMRKGPHWEPFLLSQFFYSPEAWTQAVAGPTLPAGVESHLLQASLPACNWVTSGSASVFVLLSYKGHLSLGLGVTLTSCDLIPTNSICKDPISREGHILCSQVEMCFGGHYSTLKIQIYRSRPTDR